MPSTSLTTLSENLSSTDGNNTDSLQHSTIALPKKFLGVQFAKTATGITA
jgi:hypothetical protein